MKIDIKFQTCNLQFTPEEVIKKILYSIFTNTRYYEKHFIENIDNEQLHQFRINIRKMISLLKSFAIYYETEELEYFNKLLKKSLKLTNKKRDMDVYLECLDDYIKHMEKSDKKKIKQLKKHLKKEIKKENYLIVEYLKNKRYQKDMLSFQTFILRKQNIDNHLKETAIEKVFENLINNKLDILNSDISNVDKNIPTKELHKLRIEFKEFRYLLEAYLDTCQVEDIDTFIEQLKTIQDMFGKLQDISTQIINLKSFIKENEEINLKIFKKLLKHIKQKRKDIKEDLIYELMNNIKEIDCRIQYVSD